MAFASQHPPQRMEDEAPAPVTGEHVPRDLNAGYYDLLGVHVSTTSFEAARDRVLAAPRNGTKLAVHYVSVNTIVEANSQPDLKELLNRGDLVAPDGVPLVWLGRLHGHTMTRTYGPDSMLAIIDRGREHGYTHYFYGGGPGVPELLKERLESLYPGIAVVGVYSPPFRALTPEEDEAVVRRINEANPDFVWIGLGSPKQDRWVADHRSRLNAAAVLAVGAAFDYNAGLLRKAPGWMQRSGLQWFFRLVTEPRRLWKRYTVSNARFLWLLAQDGAKRIVRRLPLVGGR
ncbi:MAG: WecB/TagA/CpsF family glycosyltransferase [Chloroflexi bacterium]|nr:WecB/TagA/CpsF family glycosyltransferase [Chloroflexota bacterium]MDA1147248.1 WecB/TagA/CpsF family glycosyltransferase [Chloroflexota bacterium]